MFSWRARRQIIAAGIVAVILGIFVFSFASRFIPDPTCSDRRKNQGELGIDCGGPCAPCELQNPSPVQVFWTRAVPIRAGIYAVAAQIENQNEFLSSPRIEYEFTLFDEAGEVARKLGNSFLLAQERAYIIETNVNTNRAPTRIEFQILDVKWELKRIERPNLVVEKRDYVAFEESGVRQSSVEAVLRNRSAFDLRETEVGFLVFDEEGNLLGANRILVEDLGSGSSKMVKSIWPRELKGEVMGIEVEPRVNVFDPRSIIIR